MVHHRCTRCKQESETRHKWGKSGVFGVFCDRCIREVRGFRPRHGGRSWFGKLWDTLTDFAQHVFQPKTRKVELRAKERETHAKIKAMEAKARNISPNPQTGNPQKY